MVCYKLKTKSDGSEYKPTADRFIEINVRGMGLILAAEERSETNIPNLIEGNIEVNDSVQTQKPNATSNYDVEDSD